MIRHLLWTHLGVKRAKTTMCVVKIHNVRSVVSSEKEVLTVCIFLLNNFLLKQALEDTPFWCTIRIACPLLLRIGFEALHLLHAQNEWLANRATQEEAGEQVTMEKNQPLWRSFDKSAL